MTVPLMPSDPNANGIPALRSGRPTILTGATLITATPAAELTVVCLTAVADSYYLITSNSGDAVTATGATSGNYLAAKIYKYEKLDVGDYVKVDSAANLQVSICS